MKKSNFVALVLGTVSGCLFSLGMCMALLPEWNAFKPGVIFGTVGILLGLITIAIWRKMENKAPIKISAKTLLFIILGIAGALTLGIGLCFCMVWNNIIVGTLIGIVGIVLLLSLIPIVKGIK